MTKIIAAFPGTGKTYFAQTAKQDIVDLDTSRFTQGYADNGKAHDSNFPRNYIHAIKNHIGKTGILLVGCQPEVINALQHEGITFILVYPKRDLKAEYMLRLQQRRNLQSFIGLLSRNWDLFLDFLESQKDCKHVVLGSNQHVGSIDAKQWHSK